MPAMAAKYTKQKRKKNSNQWKKLNFVLIENDKILVILMCLQAKLLLFQDHRALLLCESNWEIILVVVQLEKACFFVY